MTPSLSFQILNVLIIFHIGWLYGAGGEIFNKISMKRLDDTLHDDPIESKVPLVTPWIIRRFDPQDQDNRLLPRIGVVIF
jgi:hypothetical protein